MKKKETVHSFPTKADLLSHHPELLAVKTSPHFHPQVVPPIRESLKCPAFKERKRKRKKRNEKRKESSISLNSKSLMMWKTPTVLKSRWKAFPSMKKTFQRITWRSMNEEMSPTFYRTSENTCMSTIHPNGIIRSSPTRWSVNSIFCFLVSKAQDFLTSLPPTTQ